jgi:predicted HTH transcriptional regulator
MKSSNEEVIFSDIMRHLDLMDSISSGSRQLFDACVACDVEQIEALTANRDRMINLLEGYQQKIEEKTRCLQDHELTASLVDILKTWFNELNLWVEEYMALDAQILEALESAKSKTSEEIARVFQNKEKHKGYNLSSVKK